MSFRFEQKFVDPYAWLRDPDWQLVMQKPEKLKKDIRAHLQAENAYTEKIVAPITDLRNILFQELQARIEEETSTVPIPDGNWAYYERFISGGQHPIFCRRPLKGENGEKEQVLLDVNEQAKKEKFVSVGSTRHSPDHRFYATAMDRNGSEFYQITIKNLDPTNSFILDWKMLRVTWSFLLTAKCFFTLFSTKTIDQPRYYGILLA